MQYIYFCITSTVLLPVGRIWSPMHVTVSMFQFINISSSAIFLFFSFISLYSSLCSDTGNTRMRMLILVIMENANANTGSTSAIVNIRGSAGWRHEYRDQIKHSSAPHPAIFMLFPLLYASIRMFNALDALSQVYKVRSAYLTHFNEF